MKTKITLYILFLLLTFHQDFQAQTSAVYSFSYFNNGSLSQDMNGNTIDLSDATTVIRSGNNNIRTTVFDIGFDFYMLYGVNGSYYRNNLFSVNADGMLRVGEYISSTRRTIGVDGEYGLIAPFGGDLATHNTGKIVYKLVGTAPNRCLVVHWENMEASQTSTTADATFQARIYETTGIIEYVYGNMSIGALGSANNFQIGISNDDVVNRFISVNSLDNTTSTSSININNFTVGNTIPNLHSLTDGNRTIYRFTPPSAPIAPVAIAYSNVNCNRAQLNWFDGAANEVQFEIEQASNIAGPYTLLARLATNTVNYTAINLQENSTYFFRVRTLTEGSYSTWTNLGSVTTSVSCNTCTSVQDGNWNVATTWACGHVPYSYENATVMHNVKITADMWGGVNDLTVTNGGNLLFDNVNSLDFQINGDLIIDAGGAFYSAPNNTSSVYLYGNMIVNGEYDGNRGTNGTNLYFRGLDNVQITGSGAICDFFSLTVEKGFNENVIVDVLRPITIFQPIANGQSLNLTYGTFKLSSPSVLSCYFGNRNITNVFSKIWINHPDAEITRNIAGPGVVYAWRLQIDQGKFTNYGDINIYKYANINNGTVNSNAGALNFYNQLIANNSIIKGASFNEYSSSEITNCDVSISGLFLYSGISTGNSKIEGGTIFTGTDFYVRKDVEINNATVRIGDELYVDRNASDEYGNLSMNNNEVSVTSNVNLTDGAIFSFNSGNFTSGDGNDNFGMSQGSELIIKSGNINHFGRMYFDNGIPNKFTMTGGSLQIDPQHITTLNDADVVRFENNTIVDFTNGNLTIVDPCNNKTNTNRNEFEIIGTNGAKNFMGSTINFGDGLSTSAGSVGYFGFSISYPANVILDNVFLKNPLSGGPFSNRDLLLRNSISSTTNINDLSLDNSNCLLRINGNQLNIFKDFINNGDINGTVAPSHLRFMGTDEQNFVGTGTVTGIIPQLTINNSSATGVISDFHIQVTTVNLLDGIYYNPNKTLAVEGTTIPCLIYNTDCYTTGNMRRAIPNNLANKKYDFAVGKTNSYLLEMNGISTSGSGTGYIAVEPFEQITTGVGGSGVRNPLMAEGVYWKIVNNLGLVSLNTVTNVSLTQTVSFPPAKVIAQSIGQHIGGTYNSIGGAIVGNKINSLNYTITGTNPTGTTYLCVAEVNPLIGTYTVGNTGDFLNLTAVSNILREKIADDNVVFEMLADYDHTTETIPIIFDKLMTTEPIYTVTIRPQLGVTNTITQRPTTADEQPLIIIEGISKLTFDGRPGGVGTSDWSFANTRGTNSGAVFEFKNDASRIILSHLTLQSSVSSPSCGVVNFLGTNKINGNDDITLTNCNITGYAGINPTIAIYSNGTASKANNNNCILNNTIYDNFNANANTYAIFLSNNNNAWTVHGNKIYQTSPKTFNNGSIYYGLSINSGNGYTVTNNTIGFANSLQTGYTELGGSTSRFIGIQLVTASGAYSLVQNNTISGIKFSTSSNNATNGVFNPISITNGDVSVTENTIGTTDDFVDYPIQITHNVDGGQSIMIHTFAPNPNVIIGNKIGGIKINGNNDLYFMGIQTANNSGNADYIVKNNLVGSITKANSISIGNLGDNDIRRVAGIWNYQSSDITISNNTIANISVLSSSTNGNTGNRGILSQYGTNIITNNKIFNLSNSSPQTGNFHAASVIGIRSDYSSTNPITISDNLVYGLENNTTTHNNVKVVGISVSNTSTSFPLNIVERNMVHSLNSTSNNAMQYGILIDDGNYLVANNMIRLGIDKIGNSITLPHSIYGFNFNGDDYADFLNNSVYVGGDNVATSTNNTYAFDKRETKTSKIYNNIFVNNRSNADIAATSSHIAYKLSFDEVIQTDYNIYQAAGTDGVIANYDGINLYTLREMQAYSNYKDLHSGVGNPNFANPTGDLQTLDLHLTGISPAESSGFLAYSVFRDIDSEIRNINTPLDMGADAGNFGFDASVDIFAPIIKYSSVEPQSCGINNINLDVTITDQGMGVSNIVGSKPIVYYRDNTLAWNTASSVESNLVSGTPHNGVWRFNLTGLTNGTKYEYYIVAQDIATTPNIGYSKFDADAPLHTDVATATTYPDAGVNIDIFTVCVNPKATYLVGNFVDCPTCDFSSLTGYGDFFFNINAMIVDKNVTCKIVANTFEPATYSAEEFTEDPISSNFAISIVPNDGSLKTLTTSTAINKTQIRFDGADRFRIDGSFNGDNNRWLNFIHMKNDQSNFQFVNDAQNITLKNLKIHGSAALNSSGTIVIDTANVSGNKYIVIDNNEITDKYASPLNVIYAKGSYTNPAALNSDISITNNLISDFKQYAIWLTKTGNGNNWNISGNNIFNSVVTDTLQSAIKIESGDGFTIDQNSIGGSDENNSGWWNNDGLSEFNAIYFDALITNKSKISNNTIKNILLSNSGYTSNTYLFRVIKGWVDIQNNNVQSIEKRGRNTFYLIRYDGDDDVSITNNLFSNITHKEREDFYGLYFNTPQTTMLNTIDYNKFSNIKLENNSNSCDFWGVYVNNGQATLNFNTLGGTNIDEKISVVGGNFTGVYITGADVQQPITNNLFQNIEIKGNTDFYGCYFYDTYDTNFMNIINNKVCDVSITNIGNSTDFYGFYMGDGISSFNLNTIGGENHGIVNLGTGITYGVYLATNDNNAVIDNNEISNFATSGTTYGIYSNSNVPHNISNNKITNFNLDKNLSFTGIRQNAGTTNISYNLIKDVSVTNTGANTSLQALWISGGLATISSNTAMNLATNGTAATNIIHFASATNGTSNINSNIIRNISSSNNAILRAINMNVGNNSIINVNANTIENFKNNGTGDNTYLTGIELFNSGRTNITQNTIGNPNIADDFSNSGNGWTNGIFIFTGAAGSSIVGNTLSNVTMLGNNYLCGIQVAATGTASATFINNNILNNFKNSSTGTSASLKGIKAGTGNNGFYHILENTTTNFTQNGNSALRLFEIETTSSSNTISGNLVDNATMTRPYALDGMYISTGSVGNSMIQNNIIQNISHLGGGDFVGMRLVAGSNLVGNIIPNTIGSATVENSIITNGNMTIGIYCGTNPSSQIHNNLIANISAINTSTNSIVTGIELANNGNHIVRNNTIRNLSSASTKNNITAGKIGLQGIHAKDNGSFIIENNLIFDITATGNAATQVAGFTEAAPNAKFGYNKIFNIKNYSTVSGRTVNGIILTKLNSGYIHNNQISLIGEDDAHYRGIFVESADALATKRVYFNSIYLGGTKSSANSYAFFRNNVDAPLYMRNNIFSNFVSGGTGKHYAIATLNTTNWNNTYVDANSYYSSNSATCGLWGSTDVNFENWITNTGETNNLLSTDQTPIFTNPTVCDLHINPTNACGFNNAGLPIAGLSLDIDNQTRHAVHPDLGVDEFNPIGQNGSYFWRGWHSDNWDDNTNWQCECVPDNATIEKIYILNSTFSATIKRTLPATTVVANEMIIKTNANVIVNPGNSLTLTGNLTLDGTLTIETPPTKDGATGTFIDNGTITGTGNMIAKRFINGGQWHEVSSPVQTTNATSAVFTRSHPSGYFNPNFYWYDETTDLDNNPVTNPTGAGAFDTNKLSGGWKMAHNYSGGADINLVSNKGYIFWTNMNQIITYTGKPNTGNFDATNLSLTNNDTRVGIVPDLYDGWQLLGNPYPSCLDWDLIRDNQITDIDDGISVWDNTGYSAYKNGSSVMLGNLTNLIPPMQGFFVHTTANNASVQIRNEHRTHGTPKYLKNKNRKQNYLKLKTSGNGYNDFFVIHFENDATSEFDNPYDLLRMFSTNTKIPQLYSVTKYKKDKVVLNCLPKTMMYKHSDTLQLLVGVDGIYTFSVDQFNDFDSVNVVLEDRELKNFVNLKTVSQYQFAYQKAKPINRFVLHFNKNNAPKQIKQISDMKHLEDQMLTYHIEKDIFLEEDICDSMIYTISGLPSCFSFDSQKRTIVGTPQNENVGTYNLSFSAKDINGEKISTNFNLEVVNVNDAPFLYDSIPNKTIYQGENFKFALKDNTFKDIDLGDELVISAVEDSFASLPVWIDLKNNKFSGKSTEYGKFYIKTTATDKAGATASQIFSIEILVPTNSKTQNSTTDISVFPNPSIDEVFIQSESPIKTVELFNTLGEKLQISGNKKNLDIKNIPAGTYLLKIETQQGIVEKQIVKQ